MKSLVKYCLALVLALGMATPAVAIADLYENEGFDPDAANIRTAETEEGYEDIMPSYDEVDMVLYGEDYEDAVPTTDDSDDEDNNMAPIIISAVLGATLVAVVVFILVSNKNRKK